MYDHYTSSQRGPSSISLLPELKALPVWRTAPLMEPSTVKQTRNGFLCPCNMTSSRKTWWNNVKMLLFCSFSQIWIETLMGGGYKPHHLCQVFHSQSQGRVIPQQLCALSTHWSWKMWDSQSTALSNPDLWPLHCRLLWALQTQISIFTCYLNVITRCLRHVGL